LGALIPPVDPEGSQGANPIARPSDVFFGGPSTKRKPATKAPSIPALLPALTPDAPPAPGNSIADDDAEPVGASDRPAEASSQEGTPGREGGEHPSDGLVDVPGARFAEIPLTQLRANPRQPRREFEPEALEELTASIREVGLLQPIVARPLQAEESDGARYEIVMGERRWRAVQAAGLETIPAIIRGTADEDLLRDALLENLHRAQLNPLEEAAAYQQLLDDFGCTHAELSQRIARSRPQVSNTLRLLKLPAGIQRRLAAGVITQGHARALLSLDDPKAAERLADRIVAEGMTVRQTEEIAAIGVAPPSSSGRSNARPGNRTEALDALQERLADRFDTRVRVVLGKRKGRLTIEFASVGDLNRILEILAPHDPGLLRP
jgi:ParB family chromosome partitioning protein